MSFAFVFPGQGVAVPRDARSPCADRSGRAGHIRRGIRGVGLRPVESHPGGARKSASTPPSAPSRPCWRPGVATWRLLAQPGAVKEPVIVFGSQPRGVHRVRLRRCDRVWHGNRPGPLPWAGHAGSGPGRHRGHGRRSSGSRMPMSNRRAARRLAEKSWRPSISIPRARWSFAGQAQAVQRAGEAAKARRRQKRSCRLAVSVPSHSSLMRGAGRRLGERLASVEIRTPPHSVSEPGRRRPAR